MIEKLSLTELQLFIRDSLYTALPGLYWVSAEISEIRENYAGHCYLELIEKHPDETNVRAKVKGIIWNNRVRFIKPLFENITGESLKPGLKILMHVKIEYHEVYGLSLIINDVDPAFTLGEMAIRRQQIIKKLEDDGIITMNKELDFPVLPRRIAIISSENAAGYTDFMKHLTGNNYGYRFYTALFEAIMQGSETEKSVLDAFDRISSHINLFDVVVIVRGGGAQSDLSWFDNYRIAYHITQFPIPVLAGIGHEKDLSVADIVSYKSEKTPTAVADFLINSMLNAENYLIDLSTAISSLAGEILEEYSNRLQTNRMRLIPVARISLSSERERLASRIISLLTIGKDYLTRESSTLAGQSSSLRAGARFVISEARLKAIESASALVTKTSLDISHKLSVINNYSGTLGLLNPLNVLKRGYTITSVRGNIITSAKLTKEGDIIDTLFTDGRVKSRVTGKKSTSEKN